MMEQWVRQRACDGFNVMPPVFPSSLEDFAGEIGRRENLTIRDLYRRIAGARGHYEDASRAAPPCLVAGERG